MKGVMHQAAICILAVTNEAIDNKRETAQNPFSVK